MENKKTKLNEGAKKRLIEAVKRNSVIWDKSHPDHIKRKILKLAWDDVAKEMDIDVEACRTGWRSIRDSERYYKKKANKSDSVRDLEYSSDNSTAEEPWEYTEEMKFLVDPSSSRLNFSSATLNTASPAASNMSPDQSTSSYSYRSNTPNSRQAASWLNEPMFHVVDIVDCKQEKLDNAAYSNHLEPRRMAMMTKVPVGKSSQPSKSSYAYRCNAANALQIKERQNEADDHVSFLNHLDSILRKLPIRSSESLQAKIMALAYEALAKQRGNS